MIRQCNRPLSLLLSTLRLLFPSTIDPVRPESSLSAIKESFDDPEKPELLGDRDGPPFLLDECGCNTASSDPNRL